MGILKASFGKWREEYNKMSKDEAILMGMEHIVNRLAEVIMKGLV